MMMNQWMRNQVDNKLPSTKVYLSIIIVIIPVTSRNIVSSDLMGYFGRIPHCQSQLAEHPWIPHAVKVSVLLETASPNPSALDE